jgi:cystathionine beta-lyase
MKKDYFTQPVNRKDTHSIKWDLIKLHEYPKDVIPLWVADMDFKTEPKIVEALQKKVDHKIFGYHLPIGGYHQSVVDWCFIRHQADLSQATMISTFGVVNGVATCIETLTKSKDHILIFEPVYHPFKRLIEDNNRIASINELVLSNGLYTMDFEALEDIIQHDDVKMVILCSPHNPIGRVWKKEELEALMEVCMKYNLIVLSDEIHMDFVYPHHQHHVLVTLNTTYQKHVITLTSASKTFNLADTKVAQLFVYNQDYATKIKDFYQRLGLYSVSGWSQSAQEAAFKYGADYADELMRVIVSNKEKVVSMLEQANSKIKVIEPEGLYLLWLDFRAYKKDPEEIMDQLLYQAKVWLNNGSMFGKSGKGFFRMNLATTPELIEEATRRIIDSFDQPKV